MIVYFADRYMNILQKASTGLPKGFHIINDVKTEEVDVGVTVFEFDLKYDGEDRLQAREITKPGNYLLRHYDDEDEYYTIIDTEEDTSSNTIYVYAEDAGLDLLSDTYGEYTADKAYPISYYIEMFSRDSGFEIGVNEIPDLTRVLTFDTDGTGTERLLSTASEFEAELSYSFEIKGLEIKHKYINIFKKRGKDTGIRLRLNREVGKIIIKRSIANLATGYKVTGGTPKGKDKPITLSGYKYDDGDFFVSGSWLFSREANKIWSRYNSETGKNGGYMTRIFTGTSTNQKTLCSQAIASLKKAREMEENYEVELLKIPPDLKVGDTVYVVDESGQLYLSSRVLKLEIKASEKSITATLGEFLMKLSGIDGDIEDIKDQIGDIDRDIYTWIAYADDIYGSGISLNPEGKIYIGIATNQATSEPDISDPTVYTWSKFSDAEDSGWLYVILDGQFEAYNDSMDNMPQYRKVGSRVEIRGAISPSVEVPAGSDEHTIFTLPEGFRPTKQVISSGEASGMNKWTLTVKTNGVVAFSKYGSAENTSCPTTEKLSFNLSFLTE